MSILAGIIGYLIGSVPFGIVIARVLGLGDLRKIGSGNIGATNVLRTGNKSAAAATLAFDMAKGALAVILVRYLWGDVAGMLAGLGAFLGHLYPVWLGFRGGKGVATFLGVVLALNLTAGLIACGTWLITAYFGRVSSLSALCASLAAPLWLGLLDGPAPAFIGLLLSALIWWRHKENIARLLSGTESLIGKS